MPSEKQSELRLTINDEPLLAPKLEIPQSKPTEKKKINILREEPVTLNKINIENKPPNEHKIEKPETKVERSSSFKKSE